MTTSAPLVAPAVNPAAIAVNAATSAGTPAFHTTPITTEESATIEPTDRSIPPVRIMAVMTAANAPILAF